MRWIDFSGRRSDISGEFSRLQKPGIIKLSIYCSKSYAFVVLNDSEVAFLEENTVFCSFLYWVLLIHNVTWSKKYVVNFFLSYFRRYFVETCSFSAFNFCQYWVKFFFRKLSLFDVSLVIDNFFGRLISLSGIRAGQLMLHGRLEVERPPASAGPPLGRWAATLTPFVPFV